MDGFSNDSDLRELAVHQPNEDSVASFHGGVFDFGASCNTEANGVWWLRLKYES